LQHKHRSILRLVKKIAVAPRESYPFAQKTSHQHDIPINRTSVPAQLINPVG